MDEINTKRYRKLATMKEVLETSDVQDTLFAQSDFQFLLFKKRWPTYVGPFLGENSAPYYYAKDKLYIKVMHPGMIENFNAIRGELKAILSKDEFAKHYPNVVFKFGVPDQLRKENPIAKEIDDKMDAYVRAPKDDITEIEAQWIEKWNEKNIKNEKIRPLLAEMMVEVLKRRKGKIKEGYHPCLLCGELCKKEEKFCDDCQRKTKRKKLNQVVLLLKEHPHLDYITLRKHLSVTYDVYEEARDMLIHRFKENIYNKHSTTDEKRKLLAMLIHKPLKEITDEEAADILYKMPQKKWD